MAATTLETEADKIRLLEARIRAPSIWGRVPCGLRFEDLQDKRYEEAVKLVKKHYLPEELTYRSVKLHEDKEGTDEMVNNVRIWMKDKMSIAVVKEGIDKLVGVLIMRIQEKCSFSRTFSKVKIAYNENYATVKKFYNDIEKPIDLFEELHVKKYLKIYILALKARYRHRGVGKELIKAALKLAAAAHVPAICGIFTSASGQSMAEDLGFSRYRELHYVRYLNNNEIIFWDTGVGNYGAVLMAYRIPDVEEVVEDVKSISSTRYHVQPEPGIAKEVMKAAIHLATAAQIPAICGVFTSARSQAMAEHLGFSKYREINYVKYLNSNNEVIFWDTGVGNYGAALMAYRIPEVEEVEDIMSITTFKQPGQSDAEGQEADKNIGET